MAGGRQSLHASEIASAQAVPAVQACSSAGGLRRDCHAGVQVSMDLGSGFQPTRMAHPDTYLNKVVVGGCSGRMQLWNFAKGTLLYSFQLGGGDADVRALSSSPALDVVGIGMSDGCVQTTRSFVSLSLLPCHTWHAHLNSVPCRQGISSALHGIAAPSEPCSFH